MLTFDDLDSAAALRAFDIDVIQYGRVSKYYFSRARSSVPNGSLLVGLSSHKSNYGISIDARMPP